VQVINSIGFALTIAGAVTLPSSQRVLAQPTLTTITIEITPSDNSLKGRPIMVSAIRDGKVVDQGEVRIQESMASAWVGATATFNSSLPGAYDVRIEGEGIITEVKRGVQVIRDRGTSVRFVARPGKGVHIVEYATGGLAREEIATRLEKLEADVIQLQKAREELTARIGKLEAALLPLQKAVQSK
jgi:hypothetical protein